ncbi:MAG: hypothetical protein A2W00_02310 [Candidatus Eisenbacteria bacterium RBG_16_71_46]|nr:MAG: hypothetical protein A2W00_02310 [Candidatus Eisenbacteria bacterium RBG_16_71_46]
MSHPDLILRSRHVVTPRGVEEVQVVVREGRISAVLPRGAAAEAREVLDLGETYLLPGLVRSHDQIQMVGSGSFFGDLDRTAEIASGQPASCIGVGVDRRETRKAAPTGRIRDARWACGAPRLARRIPEARGARARDSPRGRPPRRGSPPAGVHSRWTSGRV